MLSRLLAGLGVVVLGSLINAMAGSAVSATAACTAPAQVCKARATVFAISSGFDPYGSAVRIATDLMVTNRHVVADEAMVRIHLPDGRRVTGMVVPTSFAGDLVLLQAAGLPPGPVADLKSADSNGPLFTVGAGLGKARATEVYDAGKLIALPPPDKPAARIHHTAYVQRGNSGGALVDSQGRLAGITTSGGEGRFEAIPASRIAKLRAMSGPAHIAASAARGEAYRDCYAALETARAMPAAKWPAAAKLTLHDGCAATENRQLTDLAAQALGGARELTQAAALFERSLAADPNGPNTRLSLVIAYQFARQHAKAVPHLRELMKTMPEEPRVQKGAVQAGKLTGDKALMEAGLAAIAKYDPRGLAAAKQFVEGRPPPRRGVLRPRKQTPPQSRPEGTPER